MSDYWFKPKRIGWGLSPANWKGWVSVLVLVLAIAGLAMVFLDAGDLASFWIGTAICLVVFSILAWAKYGSQDGAEN